MEIGRSGRVQVEDIVFLVRKDAKKYARVKELLMMNEELKKARKAFDEGKFAGKNINFKTKYNELCFLFLNMIKFVDNVLIGRSHISSHFGCYNDFYFS